MIRLQTAVPLRTALFNNNISDEAKAAGAVLDVDMYRLYKQNLLNNDPLYSPLKDRSGKSNDITLNNFGGTRTSGFRNIDPRILQLVNLLGTDGNFVR